MGMSDAIYKRMLLRRKFYKRMFILLVTCGISFYLSALLFGEMNSPAVVMRLTDLDRCPACYGISICGELYSNKIILESSYNHWSRLFNAKNIYHGYTKLGKQVILKKLAHDSELRRFDSKLCTSWGMKNCHPKDLLNASNIINNIVKIVEYNISWPDTTSRNGLVFCPYTVGLENFLQPVVSKTSTPADLINVWTMLSINPEPIILQVLKKSKGWPVPAWAGNCGRLEIVSYEGEPLSSLMHIDWSHRLKFAKKILQAAMDFTFKHERFRFYLMDWSLDNIVVDKNDEVTFVDLEDIVVLDKDTPRGPHLPNWYKRHDKDISLPGYSFSIEDLCKHHLSDYNLWAACYILAGDDNPLLYPIPEEVKSTKPYFHNTFQYCLMENDRIRSVTRLQSLIDNMLESEDILGYGAVSTY